MKISKTTLNYAAKRDIELVVDENLVSFYHVDDDSEPSFTYRNEKDGLFFMGNVWLNQKDKEELPSWIKDEKHLREMVDFIAPIMNATN
jgi:hypothetical protein